MVESETFVRRRALLLVVLLAASVACLPRVGPAVVADAGPTDSGELPAACSDGAHGGTESDVDCGGDCAPCVVGARCGTPVDCASGVCISALCAAPATGCGTFGCPGLTDLTGAVATVQFPNGNDTYAPKCLRVRFGQSVLFQGGDFATHPLAQACGPVPGALQASGGSSATFTFDQALGVFGYYCTTHGSAAGAGMAGAIEVVR